jgi:hypothetical protein
LRRWEDGKLKAQSSKQKKVKSEMMADEGRGMMDEGKVKTREDG